MKRFLSGMLCAFMLLGLLPSSALAAVLSEEKVTYLGTEAEYLTTFDTFFDENGLRKVETGWHSNGGDLNKKVGLVNKYGSFVAAPIYDEIRLKANYPGFGDSGTTTLPLYYIGGYTQAVRDGKMGLLDTNGEEVIPCQYDYVCLPSEGVCQVLNENSAGGYDLGYWNLEQNREIVSPGKYITPYKMRQIGYGVEKPAGDYLCVHDFNGGYAMVFTSRDGSGYYNAAVIDKNGTNIYGRTYLVRSTTDNYKTYPQQGQYLSFVEPKTFENYRFQKLDDSSWVKTLTFNTYATGLAGPSGILIPATYTTGVLAGVAETTNFINPSDFQIILDKGLILTRKDAKPGFLYGSAYGVISFNGKTIVPFTHGVNQELYYHENEQAFTSLTGAAYDINGRLLHDSSYGYSFFKNGYSIVVHTGNFNSSTDTYDRTLYISRPDGTLLNVSALLGIPKSDRKIGYRLSNASAVGYFWVKNMQDKWGLIDFSGKTILPFEYDEVNYNAWGEGENGFARVTQNGKVGMVNAKGVLVLPCEYKTINNYFINSPTVRVYNEGGKQGLAETQTGRLILPVEYDSIGAFASFKQQNNSYFEMGVCYAEKNGKNLLLDKNGSVVFSTDKKFYESTTGLYHFNDNSGYFDNRGRVIIPDEVWRSTNPELGGSYTIIIQDGGVYRISANYIDSSYGFKSYAPATVTATPSATKLMVNGKSISVDAYNIGGSNFIKLRDLAVMVSGTEKSFEVSFDQSKNAVNLISGKSYSPVGGEMASGGGNAQTAVRPSSKIYVDGGEVCMTAYNIGGNNYFKLRDVMQIFNVGVGYDSASGTATLDTASGYILGDYEQRKLDAAIDAAQQAGQDPYQQKPIYKEAFVRFDSIPATHVYELGAGFERAGFKVSYVDTYGKATDISGDIVLKIGGTTLTEGYVFKQAGDKTVDCYYKGELLNNFIVTVIESTDDYLADGEYYMQIYGKYLTVVKGYIELYDTKPEKPFKVELRNISEERGASYFISYDGQYVIQPTTKDGAQLMLLNAPLLWRINKYTSFCTIRDYGNQKLAVNASGQQSKNGTKVIVWSHTGKAPDNAKIVFTKAD